MSEISLARLSAARFRFDIGYEVVEKDIQNGDLIELLPRFGGTSRPFILLYPHARHMSLRVQTFVNFLIGNLGSNVI